MWWVTLDRSATPIKRVAGVVRCLCSDSRISRAVTWPSCARKTVGMPTEHRSWSVAPWYYLQPEFPKSNPFKYTTRCNFQFISAKTNDLSKMETFFASDFKVKRNFSSEDLLRKYPVELKSVRNSNRKIILFLTLHLRFLLGWLRIKL